MNPRWPFLLIAALLVPGALFGAWGVLTYGGTIEGQVADERRRAAEAMREYRSGFAAALPGMPRCESPTLHEVGQQPLSSAARIGLEYEAQGAATEALAYFERVAEPQPLRVTLARARALLALERPAPVRQLLASAAEAGQLAALRFEFADPVSDPLLLTSVRVWTK